MNYSFLQGHMQRRHPEESQIGTYFSSLQCCFKLEFLLDTSVSSRPQSTVVFLQVYVL